MPDVLYVDAPRLLFDALAEVLPAYGVDARPVDAADGVPRPLLKWSASGSSCLQPVGGKERLLARQTGLREVVAAVLAREGVPTADEGCRAPNPPLTPRELQVVAALAKGLGNAALGEHLGISRNTARTHVQNVLRKLGVEKRHQAVHEARRLGLLPVPAA